MAGADNTKEKNKRDPETAPAKQLIDAIINALTADVPNVDIISALKFAQAATGYKAPIWRAAADSLNTAASDRRPQNVAQGIEMPAQS